MYGLKVTNGDLAVMGDGNCVLVEGRERLAQEISHWLLEPLGTDALYNRFGSTLDQIIGSPMLAEYIAEVRTEVGRVLQNYMAYQTRQMNEDRLKGDEVFLKNWKDEDIIDAVEGLSVKAVADTLKVTIKLFTVAGTRLIIERSL